MDLANIASSGVVKFALAGLVAAVGLAFAAPMIDQFTKSQLVTGLVMLALGLVGLKVGGLFRFVGAGLLVAGAIDIADYFLPQIAVRPVRAVAG